MKHPRKNRRRKSTNNAHKPEQRAPYVVRKLSTFNVLSDAGLEQIEANADQILAQTGMEFQDDPEILDIFANAGCDVSGSRVRFAPGFCRKTITATAPAQFTQHARNPETMFFLAGMLRFFARLGGRHLSVIKIAVADMPLIQISKTW